MSCMSTQLAKIGPHYLSWLLTAGTSNVVCGWVVSRKRKYGGRAAYHYYDSLFLCWNTLLGLPTAVKYVMPHITPSVLISRSHPVPSQPLSSPHPNPVPHPQNEIIAIIAWIKMVGPHAMLRNAFLYHLSASWISFSFIVNASYAPGFHFGSYFPRLFNIWMCASFASTPRLENPGMKRSISSFVGACAWADCFSRLVGGGVVFVEGFEEAVSLSWDCCSVRILEWNGLDGHL